METKKLTWMLREKVEDAIRTACKGCENNNPSAENLSKSCAACNECPTNIALRNANSAIVRVMNKVSKQG